MDRWVVFFIKRGPKYFYKQISFKKNRVDDFLNDRAPKLFSQTYSLQKGQDAVFSANMKVGQIGVYLQDEVNINPRFKLTYGLRIDRPVYPEQPLENPAISALSLLDKNGTPT